MTYLDIQDVRKAFGAVQALHSATMAAHRGSIHGLCGANGAGKSTLIRILAGASSPDAGDIMLDGKPLREFSPQHATRCGIGVVHQELALVPELPVYKNIFLGIEPRRGPLPRTAAMKQQAGAILSRMGVHLDVDTRTADLGLHHQQIVEIAKALCRGTSLLILDEPTAILNLREKERLFEILRELRRSGLCIILITHFIDELFATCDRVTVMRDGRTVQTFETGETSYDDIVFAMVGTLGKLSSAQVPSSSGTKPVIGIHHGSSGNRFANVTVEVHSGEILGIAGLIGSGCYEVAEALFGLRQLDRGEIRLDGRPSRLTSPRVAVGAGIGYVPEDRRARGLCLNLAASTNVALPSLPRSRFSWRGIIRRKAVRNEFELLGRKLDLRPLDPMLEAGDFSGGGQQKLVLGKWIQAGCRIFVLVEPTRGVDVRAKIEIWRTIEELGRDGAAVVTVSTDFDDIAALCSRCLVFSAGRIIGELHKPNITKQAIATLAIAAPRPGQGPAAWPSKDTSGRAEA
jgi:ribose transport system ATP-binding protein